MFFYDYNKLSKEQIAEKLGAKPKAVSASGLSEKLAGKKLKLILDNGPTLEYEFKTCCELSLSENGGDAVCGAYSALAIKEITLVSHMIPGTERGYNLILDEKTGLVTVFEVWFCGYEDQREVQRCIYYGYVDCCGDPGKRHHITNRLEGKGFFWTDDRGVELLTFYPSVIYSSFVEISNPRGGITICAPSDFIKISDNLYIYSRVEAEFSGTFVLEVIDLYSIKQIGVRLGFDENDELDYVMYRGKGEITGQGATYEKMTDYGENLVLKGFADKDTMAKKGGRPVYRPQHLHRNLSKAEVEEAIAKNSSVFSGSSIMVGSNDMPVSEYMVGKSFTLRFDNGGPVWEYEVTAVDTLKWRNEGETEWHEEIYKAFEPAENIILFSHMHTGSPEHRNVTNAVDFSTGLVTCVDSHIGNWRSDWEVGNCVHFGIAEIPGVTPPGVRRHEFTTDLVGKSFAWVYSDVMSSIHVYSSPESYSWTIFLDNNAGGMMWSSPCFYVKLREDAYLFAWVEEKCNGSQGLMVFNPRLMHDAGYFFHADENGLSLTTLGAYARTCGDFDIMKYFDIKNRG
ncbi:MAG: MoaF N-terminal domain-containing protein [Clostridiales bacterium]|nr:MoaF N-terminal domain-containing protein [Clostridiales bacterium]